MTPPCPTWARYPLALVLHRKDGITPGTVAKLHSWLHNVQGHALPFAQTARLYPEFTRRRSRRSFFKVVVSSQLRPFKRKIKESLCTFFGLSETTLPQAAAACGLAGASDVSGSWLTGPVGRAALPRSAS